MGRAPLQNIGTEANSAASLAKRTGQNQYTDFTCAAINTVNCTFLAHFDFVSGAQPGDPGVTVASSSIPGTATGVSKSYLDVDVGYVNGFGQAGAWATALDTNYFTLAIPTGPPIGFVYPAVGGANPVPGGISFGAAR